MKKVIGIDLGGTKIYGGVIDENGKILKIAKRDSKAQEGRAVVLNGIYEVIEELMEGEQVYAIGLGSPGAIDVKEGKVLYIGGNIKDWPYTNIREELSKKFNDIPIFVENDANVAAICEEWVGAAKELDSFVMLTLGTGVGGGIYSKKSGMWYGKNYQGAELGHVILYPNGRVCNCGQKGCVEQYVSGNGIEKTYYEITGDMMKGKDIFKNIQEDENAKKAVEKYIEDLGMYLINIKNIFDPEGIVIGGGVINSMKYWWDKVIKYYEENCNNAGEIKIIPAEYLNDSGMIGAAKVAFDNL
ncbi:ROK family protein [Clostridium sp. D2Q-14]|uniref:ROK family protein n=1 Tax=Anaeromonas gelatinilytica TaxID=2683194 RepID=UPI00193C7474|nr:ROK family protein [Anaeromonas gelatinilytica]MBS4535516.1 ROK family protein [Anaeromonas gelatinilytica]